MHRGGEPAGSWRTRGWPTSSLPSLLRPPVVIEVKGSWNPDLLSAQHDQLAVRYLPEVGTDAGLYVVGWYPPEPWTATGDKGRARVGKLDRRAVERALQEQAEHIAHELKRRTYPVLVDVLRPHRTR